MLAVSVRWGRRDGDVLQTFQRTVAGPYLHEDQNENWQSLCEKMGWTDLHMLFLDTRSPLVSLDVLEQKLKLPRFAAQLNAKDAQGSTPFEYAISAHPAAVEVLLRAGANPWLVDGPLAEAAYGGVDAAIGPLIRAGIDVNQRGRDGRTALHRAATQPIQLASSLQRYQVTLELIRHGGHVIDWDPRDKWGDTPLDDAQTCVTEYPHDENYRAMLELYTTREVPAHSRYISTPQLVEVQEECDIDASQSLVSAGLRGDREAIGELIRLGAMVNERDDDGNTLLHLIAVGEVVDGYEVALEVVRHGGYGVDWEARTSDGQTALDLARETLKRQECEETKKIMDLLEARRLPPGERYVFPCMDLEYCRQCSSIEDCICSDVPMPGAFYGR